MSKYSKEVKFSAVQQYLDSNESIGRIASKLSIDLSSLKKWVRHYQQHGTKAFDSKYTSYDASFKLSVLKYVRLHGVSYQQAAAIFDIRNHGIIAKWASQYQTGGFQALKPKRKGRPSMISKKPIKKSDQTPSQKELLEELEYLRAENAYLKKYHALLQEEEAAQNKKQTSSKD